MKHRKIVVATALGLAVWPVAAAHAQAIGQNFTASTGALNFFTGEGIEPPDTMGAVGANYFVQFINGNYSVFNKSNGNAVVNIADTDFWTNAGLTTFDTTTDPRIIYDHATKRWFASMIDFSQDENTGALNGDNNFLLAVSQTSNPTGPWTGFRFAANPTNSGLLADFPRLGLNATSVYLATDNFDPSANDTAPPLNITIVSIPKSDLLAATPTIANRTMFFNLALNNVGQAIQPVVDFGPAGGSGTLVAVDGVNYGVLDRVDVLNPATTPTLAPTIHINVPLTSAPPTAQQPDTPNNIETNDDRLSAHVFKVGNSLWAAQESGDGTRFPRSQIRWYQIDATTNTLAQPGGVIGDSAHDYYFPSIAANGYGDVVIGFTRSSATEYASAYCVVGSTDASTHVTTFGAPILLQAGIAAYDAASLGAPNRWGDYSATRVDPADPWIFWTIQEWANYSEDPDFGFQLPTWSTQVTEIIIPKAGESRWDTAANGTFGNTAAWLQGAGPGATTHAIFSRATDPAGTGYTVSFAADASTDRLSVRQGVVTLDLGGHTYSVTNTSGSATPSFVVGEFGGEPRVTIANGTLQTQTTFIPPGATSDGAVTLAGAGAVWQNAGALYVGGSDAGPGGTGVLNVNGGGSLAVGGALVIDPGGTVNSAGAVSAANLNNAGNFIQTGGTFTAGSVANTASLAVGGTAAVGHISGAGNTTISTGGNLAADSIRQSSLVVNGNARIRATGAANAIGSTSVVSSLTIASSGAAWTGQLDLGNNSLVILGGGAGARDVVASQIHEGIFGDHKGITSSTALDTGATPAQDTTLGYALASDLSASAFSFAGQTVSGDDVLVKYTWKADTNLDGVVNISDLADIANHYGQTGLTWVMGDLNGDGIVNITDLALVANEYGRGTTPGVPLMSFDAAMALLPQLGGSGGSGSVPEPGSLGLLGLGIVGIMGRGKSRVRRNYWG